MPGEMVIRAADLSKVYKLYAGPGQLLLDKLRLGRVLGLSSPEHAALDGINLEIRQGERVAIIGRNGAGKSTFLKLLSGVSEPSSGRLEVRGKIHALLAIGSGFHPDFTGRQNVYAYLANQGIAGKTADALVRDIVEFAEIEDYIDQPIRVYSTGMGVRLMFAASTAIAPDILLLDEVLGVGDAYFAGKSYERMREMACGQGTTMVLVTHDIYSAVNMCERVIWLDKGRVLMDAPAKETVAAYEKSIKMQEEERLRLKNLNQQGRLRPSGLSGPPAHSGLDGVTAEAGGLVGPLTLRLKPGAEGYFAAPFYLTEVVFLAAGRSVAVWRAEEERAEQALLRHGSQWHDFESFGGQRAVKIMDYGSPFQKAELSLNLPVTAAGVDLSCRLSLLSAAPLSLRLEAEANGETFDAKAQTLSRRVEDGLYRETLAFALTPALRVSSTPEVFYGAANLVLSNPRFIQHGEERLLLESGQPTKLLMDYTIKDKQLDELLQIAAVFHKNGVQEVSRSLCTQLCFAYSKSIKGTISAFFPRFHLGCGEYTFTPLVARKDYYYSTQRQKYFTVNEEVLCCLSRCLNIMVDDSDPFAKGAAVVKTLDWSLESGAESQETGLPISQRGP